MKDKDPRHKGVAWGLPLTRPVEAVTKKMEEKGRLPPPPPRSVRDVRQLVQERMSREIGDGAGGLQRGDEIDGARLELPVMMIRPYDRNPRKSINPRREEIKESIRARGLITPFNVTRRPGEPHYIVHRGGNTRLTILQELCQEGLKQFEKVEVTFKEWRGEADAIAGHIGENEQRGDMCFWDKAVGLMEVKAELEREKGAPISLRGLEPELKRLGIPVALSHLALMKFALDRLAPLGQRLTGLDVKRIQPRFNVLARICAVWEIDEDRFYEEIVGPVLHAHVLSLDPDPAAGAEAEALMGRLEAAVAGRLGLDQARFGRVLAAAEKIKGQITRADLEEPARSGSGRRPASGPDAPSPVAATGEEPTSWQPGQETPQETPKATLDETMESSGEADAPALRQRLNQLAERLAREGWVAAHYTVCETMPLGFYMEAAGALPDDERARAAWWLLAAASGQMSKALAQSLPAGSRWRRILLQEAGVDESAWPMLVEDDLLAAVAPDGHAVLDPWCWLHLLQHRDLGALAAELATLCGRLARLDPDAHPHLLRPVHRKEAT